MSELSHLSADFLLAQKCLEGHVESIRQFQQTYRPIITAYLRSAGADPTEAEEVTESLLADCLVERPNRRPRLANFAGQALLKSWLYPLALNRLIARKRTREAWSNIIQGGLDLGQLGGAAEGPESGDGEAPLVELMKEALDAGFSECPPEDFVLLHLVHMDRLRMVEVARMFDCSKSKIDRDLETAGRKVAEATLRHIRKVDPWLDLKWDDFLELCRAASPDCLGAE